MFGIRKPLSTILATAGSALLIMVAFPLSAVADDSPWDSPPPPPHSRIAADSPWDLDAGDALSGSPDGV